MEVVKLYGLPDSRFELFIEFPWLGDKSEDLALVDRCQQSIYISISGENQPNDVRLLLLDDSKKLESGHLGHAHIGYDYMDFFSLEDFKRFFATQGEKGIVWFIQKAVPPKNLIQWEYEIQNR